MVKPKLYILLILCLVFLLSSDINAVSFNKPISEMSIAELEVKIAEILEEIKTLQALLLQLGTEIQGIPNNFTFQKDLKYGQLSIEVKYLQIFLNSDPDTRVASSGAGSPGNETQYFGRRTLIAVMNFQEKYKIEILTPLNLSVGTGYVGSFTRSKINELLKKYIGSGEQEEEEEIVLSGGYCGDNTAQRPNSQGLMEDCDGMDLRNKTCIIQGYTGGVLSCSSECSFDTSQCVNEILPSAGGKIRCGNNTDGACPSGCSHLEDNDCSYCGDNIIQAPNSEGSHEICDGNSLNDYTCLMAGYAGGTLSCSSSCLTFDTSACEEEQQEEGGPANNPPVLNPIGSKSADEEDNISFVVSGSDPDNDILYYSVRGLPSGASFSNRIFNWTPSSAQSGTYTLTFTVSDGLLTDSETITITINNVIYCGNGICDSNETCSFCPGDCGVCSDIPADYISWWKFDGNANDEKGINNGVFYGDAAIVNNTLSLDGDGDYVECGEASIFSGKSQFAISFWLKSAVGLDSLVAADEFYGGVGEDYNLYIRWQSHTRGITASFMDSTDTRRFADSFNDYFLQNQWRYVVGIYDGTYLKIYIDAVQEDSDNEGSRTIRTTTSTFKIGLVGTNYFNGFIDNVMIFDRALSLEEIENIYEEQIPQSNAPALNSIGNKSVNEGSNLSFIVSAVDIDGDELSYSVSSLPSGASFSNRIFNWTPSSAQSGTYTLTFTVSDGLLTDSETITITVNNICVPTTCISLGYECGTHSNGCGGTLNCGTCGAGETCQSGQCIVQGTPVSFDGWRVIPIKSEEEYNQGKIGGEAEQHPSGIARSLYSPDVIYLSHDVSRIWRSTDGGGTWQKMLGRNLPVPIGQSVEVDPLDPDIVFFLVSNGSNYLLSDYTGLYRSLDGGDNWQRILSLDVESVAMYQHAIDYDPTSLSEDKALTWYAATPNDGLYRSDDGGNTWTSSLGLANTEIIYDIECHPADGQTVYIATSEGFYCSYNRGADIQSCGGLPAGAVYSVEVNTQNPDIVYVTRLGQGLYKSIDGGSSFSLLKSFDAQGVYLNPNYPNTMYLVGIGDNAVVSHDGGNTWTEIISVPASGLGRSWKTRLKGIKSGVVPDPRDSDEAVAFSLAAIWKTTDGGYRFVDSSTLFTGFAPNYFSFDEYNPERFATFNSDVGMLITNNNGDYFERKTGQTHYWYATGLIDWFGSYSGEIQPVVGSETIVASIGYIFHTQLMQTTDEGDVWNLATTGEENEQKNFFIGFNSNNPNIVYAGNKISYNAGISFNMVDFGSYSDYNPSIMDLCRSNPDTIYALSSDGRRVFRSDNSGTTWYSYISYQPNILFTPYDSIPTFAVDPADCDKIYGLVDRDLAVYDGTSWRKTGVLNIAGTAGNNFIRRIAIDPNNSLVIYAVPFQRISSSKLVLRSLDGGYTWEDITYNIPDGGKLRVNPHTGEVLMSLSGTWIFPSPDMMDDSIYDKAISRPSCHDGLKNGDETGVDSGGSCSP